MKFGEIINGYEIVTEPQGGAQGQWAIGIKFGVPYFLKMFLQPKYPREGGPGSPDVVERKRKECTAFEQRNLKLNDAIERRQAGGGNLVVTKEIFRSGSTYYKVTKLVVPSPVVRLIDLHPHQALTVLRTVALSIRVLHRSGFIHGDLKAENVVIQESKPGIYVGKLIDFDDGYASGNPPTPESVVGDQRFYSPELLSYIKGRNGVDASDITTAGDIFAVGILFHVLLLGEFPTFDRSDHRFVCEAVLTGVPVTTPRLTGKLRELVESCLAADPNVRPSIDSVIEHLDGFSGDTISNGIIGSRPPNSPHSSRSNPISPSSAAVPPRGGPGLKSTMHTKP
jgi:serine/threonine protein kinase